MSYATTTVLPPFQWEGRETAGLSFERLERVRTFGGWYQHTIVRLNGQEVGRIQVRRRNKRTETLTVSSVSGAVIGSDVNWLLHHAEMTTPIRTPSADAYAQACDERSYGEEAR